VSVLALSRPLLQIDEKTEDTKGEGVDRKLDRCGMDPARSRESRAELGAFPALYLGLSLSGTDNVPGRKGLDVGVGLELLDAGGSCDVDPGTILPGGNLDGTVPARDRRVSGLCWGSSGIGMLMLGKVSVPSSPGDSGIVSRKGVDTPLAVGGPQP